MRVLVIALVLALVAAAVQSARLESRNRDIDRLGLVADSLEAAQDTTRVMLVDSLRVVQRRVLQVRQRGDSLDRVLKAERKARAVVVGVIPTVSLAAAPRFDSNRVAAFDVYREPFRVVGTVALSDSARMALITWTVRVDTARLELRIGCRSTAARTVRAAEVGVFTPLWLHATVVAVEQDPSVCNPPRTTSARFVKRALSRANLSFGYAITPERNGALTARPGILLGVRVWP